MRKTSNTIKFIQVQNTEEELRVITEIQISNRVEEYNFELGTCINQLKIFRIAYIQQIGLNISTI